MDMKHRHIKGDKNYWSLPAIASVFEKGDDYEMLELKEAVMTDNQVAKNVKHVINYLNDYHYNPADLKLFELLIDDVYGTDL